MTAEVKATGTAAWPARCPRCDDPIVKGSGIVLLRVGEDSSWVHAAHVPQASGVQTLRRCEGCLHPLRFPPDVWRNGKFRAVVAPGRCLNPNCDVKETG